MPSFVWAVSSTQSWIAIYKRTHQIYQALALNYKLPMRHQTYQQKKASNINTAVAFSFLKEILGTLELKSLISKRHQGVESWKDRLWTRQSCWISIRDLWHRYAQQRNNTCTWLQVNIIYTYVSIYIYTYKSTCLTECPAVPSVVGFTLAVTRSFSTNWDQAWIRCHCKVWFITN